MACTEYLTAMHTGDRTAETPDAGGTWPAFDGVLVRGGYGGYTHLDHIAHAWCGVHHAARPAQRARRRPGRAAVGQGHGRHSPGRQGRRRARPRGRPGHAARHELARIRNRYLGALAHGRDQNTGRRCPLADEARKLIRRFGRYEDMILRFATNLAVPFSNNLAERDQRPVKVQQRTSGGCWRTLQGLADFAIVQSYLSTAGKWGRNKLDTLTELFTTGAWLPPALTPEAATAAA